MATRRTGGSVLAETSTRSYIRAGFGLGVGTILATIVFMIVAMAFFVPGFIIVKKQHKKDKKERNTGMLVTGYVLMGLGVVLGMGLGAGIMFQSLGEEF